MASSTPKTIETKDLPILLSSPQAAPAAGTSHIQARGPKSSFDPHAEAKLHSATKSQTKGDTAASPTKKSTSRSFYESHLDPQTQPPAQEQSSWISSAKKVLTLRPKDVSDWWYGSSSKSEAKEETKEKEQGLTTIPEAPEAPGAPEVTAASGAVKGHESPEITKPSKAAAKSSEEWKKISREIDPLQKDLVVVPGKKDPTPKEKK
ncbi:hypothetical protein DL98DRAFT_541863 [Cadophora sp. DSE1049]|nr:hypothetical protein DL98DRAFT_541863 [Cadophora sp. DSE1049]